ncbi:MAG: EAL domain-containing protein [Colwellia sp.]|nr:EAL domain-containing protein [Colwellia sp.]
MNIPRKSAKLSATELRQCAEAQLKKQLERNNSTVSEKNANEMLHELQVNQIVLEIQNEELQQTLIAERKYAQRYIALFEFSPIGYFVLDSSGFISQLNLQGANLLGMERAIVVGQTFLNFMTAQHKDTFKRFLAKVFVDDGIQSCEVEVQTGKRTLWFSIEANIGITGTDCLTAMIDITERKLAETEKLEAELQLVSLNRNFITLLDNITDFIYYKDMESRFQFCSQELARITGHEKWQDMIGKNDFDVFPADTAEVYHEEERDIFQKGIPVCNQVSPYYNEEGQLNWVSTSKWPIFDDDKKTVVGLFGISRDVTAQLKSEQKTKLAASVFTHAREGIIITDATATIINVNDAFTRITGYSREEAIGQNPSFLQSGRQSPQFYADMWQALLKEDYWSGELWNRRKNGEVYAVIKTISAVRDEHGITTHYVSLANDITRLKAHQDQLEHIAHYDLLTNLPNRVLLADRLSQAMLQCSRHVQSLAVLFLDLDGFKKVNDAHGHDLGDELLIALSVRMKEALREGDSLARIGGDEFVAVLADLAKVEDCEPVLERLLLAASEPITIGDVVLNVSASIGVTLYPQDNVDADQLMRHADQAMYVAKQSGKNRYHLFDTAQDDAIKVQRESLEAIRRALDKQQFLLHYQPKVNMRTGSVTGVEALIRWQHPERGLLNSIEFLPSIENNPMSIEMGEWVIDSALTQISQWQAMGLNLPVSTSVNIAAVQLQQTDFVDRLTALLAAHPDVEPCYLQLEVLETSALNDVHHVSKIMSACIALGVNFALDDFGTGYSSLTYLRRLPANLIKIDQTFVRDMLNDVDDLAIVEGVIALAKSFKRDVIAEGVETIEHGTALLKLGCDLAQGYGIARPMPASDIPAWVNDWKPDVSWQT